MYYIYMYMYVYTIDKHKHNNRIFRTPESSFCEAFVSDRGMGTCVAWQKCSVHMV